MNRVLIGFTLLVMVMIAIPVLLAWTGGRRKLRVGRRDGVITLRMPRGHHAILASLAVLPFAAFTAIALAVSWSPESGASRYELAAFTGALGLLSGGYLLLLELRGCIRLDDRGFEKVGALTRRRSAWTDVAKITFNPVNNWFYLTLRDGRRVYVVEGLHGIADFADLALARLPAAVLAESPPAVEALKELAES